MRKNLPARKTTKHILERIAQLPVWGAYLIFALVYGLVLYFERKPPLDTESTNEHSSCVEELPYWKTESHTSGWASAEAVGGCIKTGGNQKRAWNRMGDSALNEEARDLQQCQMLLDEQQHELEGMRDNMTAIGEEVGRRRRQMDTASPNCNFS